MSLLRKISKSRLGSNLIGTGGSIRVKAISAKDLSKSGVKESVNASEIDDSESSSESEFGFEEEEQEDGDGM